VAAHHLAEYRKARPAWETVIDIDALGRAEKENWVWAGATCHGPDYRRCLVSLSRGGADATVVREFDTVDKRFVAKGFELPEAKSSVDWLDADTVYVATDFGPGSLSEAGYPRIIKRWRRGQALADAVTVFEAGAKDIFAWVSVDHTPGFERTTFGRASSFYRNQQFLLQGTALQPIDKPEDAKLAFWREHLLLELRSDWTVAGKTWPRGACCWSPRRRLPAKVSGSSLLCSRPAPHARWRTTPPRAAAWCSTCWTTWPAGWKSGTWPMAAGSAAAWPRPTLAGWRRMPCTTRCCPMTRWPSPTCSMRPTSCSPIRCSWAAPAATNANT
jgi:prolyl oligopeptidase PreP (S9A serine peptidase family)